MKRKRNKRTEADKPSPIEIRNHANGRLDEIVARGAHVHLEHMDSNYWWMGLEIADRVFVSRFFGHEMTLFFSPFEVVILGLAVFIAGQIAEDGESNWLEGVQLIVVYLLAALGFLLL